MPIAPPLPPARTIPAYYDAAVSGADALTIFLPFRDKIVASRETSLLWKRHVAGDLDGQISGYAELCAGWDSYDALPPSHAAVQHARDMLAKLRELFLIPNAALPSAEGGIALVFTNGDRYAQLEILNSGSLISLSFQGKATPAVKKHSTTDSGYLEAIETISHFISG